MVAEAAKRVIDERIADIKENFAKEERRKIAKQQKAAKKASKKAEPV